MKKRIFGLFFLLPWFGFSQLESDVLVKNYKLNFALPDFPAFTSLGTVPSAMLRPSNVEDFGFVSSEFFNGSSLVIPNAFAVEISPILLMNVNKMTLSAYQKNNLWKTSRFSIGSQRDSLQTHKLSIGYRVSVINKGDLRMDKAYLRKFMEIFEKRAKLKGTLRTAYLKANGITIDAYYAHQDSLDVIINAYIEDRIDYRKAEFDAKILALKEAYKETHWNAEKLDLAVALVGMSPDALARNIRYNSLWLWATYARPMFKNSGQLLVGVNYRNYTIDAMNYHAVSLSNRNYFGSNKLKGFFEEQLEYEQENEGVHLLLNVGAEVNLKHGFWVDLSAGFTRDTTNDTSDFVSQFRFRYTLPEKAN